MGLIVHYMGDARQPYFYPPIKEYLIMVIQCDGFRLNRRTYYRTYCSECHRYVGDVDARELQGLMTGAYGKVICFDCEDRWIELFGFGPNGPEVVVE